MNDYLQAQKVTHRVESAGGDGKDDKAETLTVKIYGVTGAAQQDALCAALSLTAKKDHVRDATVLFYTPATAAAGQPAVFQPSQLPSGNGDVEFPREARAAGNQLQRTVKL